MSKGSSLVIILIFFIFVALGGIFFWQYWNSQKTKEQLQDIINQNNTQADRLSDEIREATKSAESESNLPRESCVDTDGGQDYYANGTIKYQKYDEAGSVIATSDASDDCVNTFIGGQTKRALREYYCDTNNKVQYSYFVCPNGCNVGVCVR